MENDEFSQQPLNQQNDPVEDIEFLDLATAGDNTRPASVDNLRDSKPLVIEDDGDVELHDNNISAMRSNEPIVVATLRNDDNAIEIRDLEAATRVASARALNPHRYAAKGGAIGSITLGVMAVLGAMISSASVVTGLLGILLGLWGLTSKYVLLAAIGLGLSLVGIALSVLLSQLNLTLI
jgi:hypothetical protein